MKRKIKRGEIYMADLDPVVCSEQGGERPVLIVQNDLGNRYSTTVIVIALTSRSNKKLYLPTHVYIESSNLSADTIALAEQIRTIDKSRIIKYIGCVNVDTMKSIDKALKISLGVE